MKFYELPQALKGEINKFDQDIKGYLSGEINPIQFKGIRVAHGVYEQRKPETHMIRIRCAGGGATPAQLRHVGLLAKKYGSGEIHVTTRQEMQIHYVDLENVISVYNALTEVGLSSRGGGGNTVRNILASYDSGVTPDEVFDVAPYASELTTRLIDEADSWNLPRKFKISFSNNDQDTARSAVTCLGFIAKIKDGQKGFKVMCAGGQGSKPMMGQVLFEFVSDDQVYAIAKAMKIMFDKYGNRRQRSKARLKFLWDKLGREEFLNKFHAEYDLLKGDTASALKIVPFVNESALKPGYAPEEPVDQNFDQWKARYVRAQKQAGLVMIKVPLKLGDIDGDDAAKIADVLDHFGDNVIRFSIDQNIHFRNIPETHLGNIYNLITQIESLSTDPELFGNMIACTGADTCKLGICLPRGVTPNIQDALRSTDLNLDALSDLKIHISGCPNTCGCHHVADLGFFGKVLRQGKDMLPGYNILGGASLQDGAQRFSEKVDEIAAKYLPQFIKDFAAVYLPEKSNYASFRDYFDARGAQDIQAICENYRHLPTMEEDEGFYYDWGADERFSLLKGQKAECSAGMFDMIDVDAGLVKEARMQFDASDDAEVRAESAYRVAFSTARMLLVTRGIECKTDEQVFENFIQHFIRTDLVDSQFTQIALWGKEKNIPELIAHKDELFAMADAVRELYQNMDDSLRFKGKDLVEPAASVEVKDDSRAERFKDLRGVGCPMNFVKVKIELAGMKSGERIAVLLDDGAPIENVPGSVKNEGHQVVKMEQQGAHWMIVIEKA